MSTPNALAKFYSPRDREAYERLKSTIPMPNSYSEVNRLKYLRQTHLLYSEPNDSTYDRYTSMIARIFEVPYAFLYLVDIESIYIKSSYGTCPHMFTRSSPFIANFVLDESADVEFIKDIHLDHRFDNTNLNKSYPAIQFYGACPVRFMGSKIGILGILDYKTRQEFTVDDRMNLLDVGITVSALFNDHVANLSKNVNERASIMYEIIQSMKQNIEQLHDVSNNIHETMLSAYDNKLANVENNETEREDTFRSPKAMPDLIHGANHLHAVLTSSSHIVESYFRKSVEFTPIAHTESSSLVLNQLSDQQILDQPELYGNIIEVVENAQDIIRGYLKINKYLDPSMKTMAIQRIVDWDIDLDSLRSSPMTQLFNADLLMYSLISIVCDVLNDWKLVLIKISYDNRASHNSRYTSRSNSPRGKIRKQYHQSQRLYHQHALLERGKLLIDIQVFNPREQSQVRLNNRSEFSVEPFLSEFGATLLKSTVPLSEIPMRYSYSPTDEYDVSGVLYSLSLPCCTKCNSSILATSLLSNNIHIIHENEVESINHHNDAMKSKYHVTKLRVLVVDDSVATQRSLKLILSTHCACEVTVADHGKLGLEALKEGDYHVVFLDFLMPVMHGLDMLKSYADIVDLADPGRPIMIGMSHNFSLNEMVLGYNYGLHGYISHPITMSIIVNIIDIIRESNDLDDAIHQLADGNVLIGSCVHHHSPTSSSDHHVAGSTTDRSDSNITESLSSSPMNFDEMSSSSSSLISTSTKHLSNKKFSLFPLVGSFSRQHGSTAIMPEEQLASPLRQSTSTDNLADIPIIPRNQQTRSSKKLSGKLPSLHG